MTATLVIDIQGKYLVGMILFVTMEDNVLLVARYEKYDETLCYWNQSFLISSRQIVTFQQFIPLQEGSSHF